MLVKNIDHKRTMLLSSSSPPSQSQSSEALLRNLYVKPKGYKSEASTAALPSPFATAATAAAGLTTESAAMPPPAPRQTAAPAHDPKSQCFIDLGVYTKNRVFRILGSTKFGKSHTAVLRIAAANQFPFPPAFNNTLLFLSEHNAHIQAMQEKQRMQPFSSPMVMNPSMNYEIHAESLAYSLIVPVQSGLHYRFLEPTNAAAEKALGWEMESMRLRFESPKKKKKEGGIGGGESARVYYGGGASIGGGGSGSSKENEDPLNTGSSSSSVFSSSSSYLIGTTYTTFPSPFPCLDAFVNTCLSTHGGEGIHGRAKSWRMNSESSISFTMGGNKYCSLIGRQHKNNSVYWLFNLKEGLYYERCFDPDCRSLRGSGGALAIPEKVQEGLFDQAMVAAEMEREKEFDEAVVAAEMAREREGMREKEDTESEERAFEEACIAMMEKEGL
jgi:uncharacterized membrane protein YgcG